MQWKILSTTWVKMKLQKSMISYFLFLVLRQTIMIIIRVNKILVNVSLQIFLNITGCNRKYVSAREYYCYKLHIRPNEFNIMFYGGRLFQQWLVVMFVKVESMRLDWYSFPKHQKIIRAELYRGIVDTLKAGEARASEVCRGSHTKPHSKRRVC
jgi:hypothetical protein